MQCVLTNDGRGAPVDKVRATQPRPGSLVEEGTQVQVHYYGSPPSPLRIAAASDRPVRAQGEVFFTKDLQVLFGGFRVVLSSTQDGTGNIVVDDGIEIAIIRPDGTTRPYSQDFSGACTFGAPTATGPRDLTSLFAEGTNSVRVTMRDRCGTAVGSSDLWLVFK